MIYTITFNPALDYIVSVDQFTIGMTNRTVEETILAGGKGVNVSMVLHNLGFESIALGFIAGFTGEEIRKKLEEAGCRTEFITVRQGMSRINVKLKSVEGTEINGLGPNIDEESMNRLLNRLDELNPGDILVLAGSIPAAIPDSIYKNIMERLSGRNILIAVDATRDLLMNVLEHRPFLIKPNHHELGEIFGVEIHGAEEVIPYAVRLKELGARNVLVSMAGDGAVLAAEDGKIYHGSAPEGKLVNAVGAGDSMVAGFLAGYLEHREYEKAFKMGIATGSASAFSKLLATKEEVEILLKKMEGEEEV